MDKPSVVEQVRKAYADSYMEDFEQASAIRELEFRATEALASGDKELAEALAIIGDYNEFDGPKVARALAQYDCAVVVARESSVCLYIYPNKAVLKPQLERVLHDLSADEIDDQPDGSIRAWWD